MKKKLQALPGQIESLCGGGICVIFGLLMLTLTCTAFLFTTGMEIVADGDGMDSTVNRIFELDESVVYYSDSFVVNLLFLVLAVYACRLILPAISRLRFSREVIVLTVWTLALGMLWVFSSQVKPTFDSQYVTDSAAAFARGDFSDLSGDYLREYPFQLGYIGFCELILRAAALFGGPPETAMILEAANVVCLAAAYAGLLWLSKLLLPDPRAVHLTFLLLLLCAQPLVFCSFTYGIVPGLACAVWAIVFQTLWLRRSEAVYGLLAAVFLGFAVLLKSNNLIVLIAMLITAAMRLFKRRQFIKDLAVMLAMCICAFSFSASVKLLYQRRSGVTPGPGLPYVSWIAMGLSESRRAPGWYSNVSSNVKFRELGSDPEALAAHSKNVIKERLSFFAENPQYTRDFFSRKFVSQFNETTYQSLWNNQVRAQYGKKTGVAAWACGKGEAAVRRYMDAFAQTVFVGMLAALALMLRRREYGGVILPLAVLGGMLFHLLSEGKSQYALPYFILMIPPAAWGLAACCDAAGRVSGRLFRKTGEKTQPPPDAGGEPDPKAVSAQN